MTFQEWCEPILKQINVLFECNYGEIGTGYIKLLIVQGSNIISIGEFVYNLWRRGDNVPDEMKVKLGQEAEKYRTGQREKVPTLCYHGNKLNVS